MNNTMKIKRSEKTKRLFFVMRLILVNVME